MAASAAELAGVDLLDVPLADQAGPCHRDANTALIASRSRPVRPVVKVAGMASR